MSPACSSGSPSCTRAAQAILRRTDERIAKLQVLYLQRIEQRVLNLMLSPFTEMQLPTYAQVETCHSRPEEFFQPASGMTSPV